MAPFDDPIANQRDFTFTYPNMAGCLEAEFLQGELRKKVKKTIQPCRVEIPHIRKLIWEKLDHRKLCLGRSLV
jgi:hypothetical protein